MTQAKVKYKVHAHQPQQRLVSARHLGLVLWPRLLVVRRRLRLVSRLGRVGLPAAACPAGGARSWEPPEVVLENEVEIGPDGTVKVPIDTSPAKELHGDQDHKYAITAEVVDESRRTIVGTGNVLVARKPFQVFAWVDRGHYRAGDTIEASFDAQTLDQQAGPGQGRADPVPDHLRRQERAGREGRADLEARHRRRGPGPPADQGRRAGPVSPVVPG